MSKSTRFTLNQLTPRLEYKMKHILITIAAVVLVGCGESQQSVPQAETKPVDPVAEAAKPEPPTAKAPGISIHEAAEKGNIKIVNQHLAAGIDVNAKEGKHRMTPLHIAAIRGNKEIAELLIAKGADVNAKAEYDNTPLLYAALTGHKEIADLLRKHGGKTGEELKAAGN